MVFWQDLPGGNIHGILWSQVINTIYIIHYDTFRAVARSEIPGGLVVLGGDNVSPLVKIGLADLPNIGGAKAPQPPPCDGPVHDVNFECYIKRAIFLQ